jgi:hypothetical protein
LRAVDRHDRSAVMTVAILTLIVVALVFSAEIGWLCRC